MTLVIMQPYIFPYIGYLQLIQAADKFIFYDDVAFIKQGWINRNNILLNRQCYTFSLPVKYVSSFKTIRETQVSDRPAGWAEKLLKTIQQAYAKAPNFEFLYPKIAEILRGSIEKSVADVAAESINLALEFMEIEKEVAFSSKIYDNSSLKSVDRVLDMCQIEGATTYINAIGGQELYDKDHFKTHNLDLFFLKTHFTPYAQGKNPEFVAGLSIIDVMMFNPPETIREMLKNYTLI